MKKLLYFLGVLTISVPASAQLQNLNFENWTHAVTTLPFANKPDGWIWTNSSLTNATSYFYYPPETDAQSGNYALRLSVWYNYTKDGAVQTAGIDYRPANLKGYYKYEHNILSDPDQAVVDTAKVSVILTKWDEATLSNIVIGSGHADLLGADEFEEFTVDIEYSSPAIPDSVTVVLDPSILRRYPESTYQHLDGDGTTSYFTVDNLSLSGAGPLTVREQDFEVMPIRPNPVKDKVYFTPFTGNVLVFDLSGKQVMSFTLQNHASIDIGQLQTGSYFLQFIDSHNKMYLSKLLKQ